MPLGLGFAVEVKTEPTSYEVVQASASNWTLLPSCNQESMCKQTYVSVHFAGIQTVADHAAQSRTEGALLWGTCLSLFGIHTMLLDYVQRGVSTLTCLSLFRSFFFTWRKFISLLLGKMPVVVIPSIFSSSIFLWASRASCAHAHNAYRPRLYNHFLVHYGMGAWMRCSDVRWCVGKSITVWICGNSYQDGFYTESRFHDFFFYAQ